MLIETGKGYQMINIMKYLFSENRLKKSYFVFTRIKTWGIYLFLIKTSGS